MKLFDPDETRTDLKPYRPFPRRAVVLVVIVVLIGVAIGVATLSASKPAPQVDYAALKIAAFEQLNAELAKHENFRSIDEAMAWQIARAEKLDEQYHLEGTAFSLQKEVMQMWANMQAQHARRMK